tara:strand:- start:27663 stop:28031 length:369 start_codon:yes stop_codon:yes gene_type:complete
MSRCDLCDHSRHTSNGGALVCAYELRKGHFTDYEIPHCDSENRSQHEAVQTRQIADRLAEENERLLCRCGSGNHKFALHDARGIFCDYVCDSCENEKRSKYRLEIFTDGNYEADEPIEPEGY